MFSFEQIFLYLIPWGRFLSFPVQIEILPADGLLLSSDWWGILKPSLSIILGPSLNFSFFIPTQSLGSLLLLFLRLIELFQKTLLFRPREG